MTKTQIEKLRTAIVALLTEYDILGDCTIYANGKRWIYGYKVSDDAYELALTEKVEDNIDVKEYLEYCNPDTISITFDGSGLYGILNYDIDDRGFIERFNALLKEYGLYYEQGFAWSLSLYEI